MEIHNEKLRLCSFCCILAQLPTISPSTDTAISVWGVHKVAKRPFAAKLRQNRLFLDFAGKNALQTEGAVSFDGEHVGNCAKIYQKEHSLSFSLRVFSVFYDLTIKSYGQFGLTKWYVKFHKVSKRPFAAKLRQNRLFLDFAGKTHFKPKGP